MARPSLDDVKEIRKYISSCPPHALEDDNVYRLGGLVIALLSFPASFSGTASGTSDRDCGFWPIYLW